MGQVFWHRNCINITRWQSSDMEILGVEVMLHIVYCLALIMQLEGRAGSAQGRMYVYLALC